MALANNRICCLRSLLHRSTTWSTRLHVTPQYCFKQYSSPFLRFRSTFREDKSPRNLQNIFKSLLLRLGAGSAAVLLIGSYLYDGEGGNRQTLSTIAECRQPPVPQRLVKLPTSEKLTLEDAIVIAKDLAECKKVNKQVYYGTSLTLSVVVVICIVVKLQIGSDPADLCHSNCNYPVSFLLCKELKPILFNVHILTG